MRNPRPHPPGRLLEGPARLLPLLVVPLLVLGLVQAPGASAATGATSGLAGKWVDVADNSAANGTRLQIWTCTGGANQKWNAPTGGSDPGSGAMAVAPYLYEGWGSPPSPTTVMNATGVKWFTLAFVLSNGYCNPQWDGGRPLTGGVDQQTVNTVRGAGGDVIPSFGGWSGNKLESSCSSAGELAAAYRR